MPVLSPEVAARLKEAGHDAAHVGDELRLDGPDREILQHAALNQRVIIAADMDFGELLARWTFALFGAGTGVSESMGGRALRR